MQESWKPKRGDIVVRHPRQNEIKPISVEIKPRKHRSSKMVASPIFLIYGFAILIAFGTGLLMLPISNAQGITTPFKDAFFTATSAVTVTGLVVQESSTYWSQVGQGIILGLIFIGGLGFMTGATFLFIIIGRRITLVNRMLMRESLGINKLGGLIRLTRNIVLFAVLIQLLGFIALLSLFRSYFTMEEAIWQAAFHAVSAFNNAGFTILPHTSSLAIFQNDGPILGIFTFLIIMGSISYLVLFDIIKYKKFRLFTVNTKLVLLISTALWLIGALIIFLAEHTNPATLGPLSLVDKIINAFFHSVSGRTAGFVTVGFGTMRQHTDFFIIGLMFIGGASASTAGGIKVNSFAIILITLLATLKGHGHTSAFGREIPARQVYRALLIGALAITFVFIVSFLLAFAEPDFPFVQLLFETVSAFGTVGMTSGKTAMLSNSSQLILIMAMFIGRIGPLSLVLIMAAREKPAAYRYAQERVTIG